MKIYPNFPEHGRLFLMSSRRAPFLSFLVFGILSFSFVARVCAEPSPSPTIVDVLPPDIPGPTPMQSTPPLSTASQLIAPREGNTDATQNVNTAVVDPAPNAGPTPPDVGVSSEPPTAADPNALISAPEERRVSPEVSAVQQKEIALRELAKYKAVKIQAEKVPAIRRLYDRAQKASTEEEYRAALREYYRMLFKKIELLDPSLAPKAKGMLEAYLQRLAQTHIEPTIPLHPPPTPVPLNYP